MKYRTRPYNELSRLVDAHVPTLMVKGPSEAEYQVAVRVYWEAALATLARAARPLRHPAANEDRVTLESCPASAPGDG